MATTHQSLRSFYDKYHQALREYASPYAARAIKHHSHDQLQIYLGCHVEIDPWEMFRRCCDTASAS